MRADEIGSGEVLRELRTTWSKKRETAQRVRQRISEVTKFAIAADHRLDPSGDRQNVAGIAVRGKRCQSRFRSLNRVADD